MRFETALGICGGAIISSAINISTGQDEEIGTGVLILGLLLSGLLIGIRIGLGNYKKKGDS